MDEETSLLVLIPSGIAALIEMWKVTKGKNKISNLNPILKFVLKIENGINFESTFLIY